MSEHLNPYADAVAAKLDFDLEEHHREGVDLARQHQEYTDTTARYEAGEDVIPGDCWRACLASLLEVPLAEVPHFIHLYDGGVGDPEHETWSFECKLPDDQRPNGDARDRFAVDCPVCVPQEPRWWLESIAWVEQQRPGWTLRAWERDGFPFPFYYAADAPTRVIVTAPSPRGPWNHSALYCAANGELAHDPFPGGEGVLDGPGDVVTLVREEWL